MIDKNFDWVKDAVENDWVQDADDEKWFSNPRYSNIWLCWCSQYYQSAKGDLVYATEGWSLKTENGERITSSYEDRYFDVVFQAELWLDDHEDLTRYLSEAS